MAYSQGSTVNFKRFTSTMSQPSRTPLVLAARVVLHATALYFCVYAFNGLETISDLTEIQIESLYAGHYSYLTIIGLCFTTVTHALALVDDFVGSFLPRESYEVMSGFLLISLSQSPRIREELILKTIFLRIPHSHYFLETSWKCHRSTSEFSSP